MLTLALTFLAGVLTIVNPCVLPLLPIVLGASLKSSRYGIFAFAFGMAIAFAATGIFLASLGMALGISPMFMRQAAAGLLMVLGLLLLIKPLGIQFAVLASSCTQSAANSKVHDGVGGQFLMGVLTGIIWSPCTGPTLGAAFALATHSNTLLEAALRMGIFSFGAVLPLIAFGTILRPFLRRNMGQTCTLASRLKTCMGIILLTTGAFILLGWDKALETFALNHMPTWWVDLSTQL